MTLSYVALDGTQTVDYSDYGSLPHAECNVCGLKPYDCAARDDHEYVAVYPRAWLGDRTDPSTVDPFSEDEPPEALSAVELRAALAACDVRASVPWPIRAEVNGMKRLGALEVLSELSEPDEPFVEPEIPQVEPEVSEPDSSCRQPLPGPYPLYGCGLTDGHEGDHVISDVPVDVMVSTDADSEWAADDAPVRAHGHDTKLTETRNGNVYFECCGELIAHRNESGSFDLFDEPSKDPRW